MGRQGKPLWRTEVPEGLNPEVPRVQEGGTSFLGRGKSMCKGLVTGGSLMTQDLR